MSVCWRKVLGDLRENFWQVILVGVALLVGTTAIMTTFGAHTIMSREIESSFHSSRPAVATLWLDAVDGNLAALARTYPGVADADVRRIVRARAEVVAGDWQPLLIFGVEDFQDLRLSTFHSHSGAWPPKEGELLLEQSALPILQVQEEGTLPVRVPSGKVANLRISGIVHDPGLAPGWMDQIGYGYATKKTLASLGEGGYLNELQIVVTDQGEQNQVISVAAELAQWLTAKGHPVRRVEVPPASKHPHADQMGAMLLLLRFFSVLALILSSVLAASVMAALLAKQVRQVGIMKSMGATSIQVAALYLRFILILAVITVVIGLPIGALAAGAFARFASLQLNLEVTTLEIPLLLFGMTAAIGIGIPLLVALVPVLRATRMTAREAIYFVDLQLPVKRSGSRRILPQFSLDYSLVWALRNTFRRPARLWLTLSALALGGAVLMTSVNIYGSLVLAMDKALDARGDDVEMRLLRPAPSDLLVQQVRGIPGIKAIEAWGMALSAIELPQIIPGATVGTERYTLFAPPVNTQLLHLPLVEGRWPSLDESGVLVINRTLQDRERRLDLRVGSEVSLLVAGRKTPVRIIGVVEEVSPPSLYTTPITLEQVIGMADSAADLRIVTDAGTEQQVTRELEQVLVDNGWFPFFMMTNKSIHRAMTDHFLILLILLGTAALSVVIVGGLMLATSMSLAVLERARELGILRALGATRRTVFRILLIEGATAAALSVVIAVILSVPLSAGGGSLVGNVGLHVAMPLVLSPLAIGGWLCLATIVTSLACLFPALSSLRVPVCDALAQD